MLTQRILNLLRSLDSHQDLQVMLTTIVFTTLKKICSLDYPTSFLFKTDSGARHLVSTPVPGDSFLTISRKLARDYLSARGR